MKPLFTVAAALSSVALTACDTPSPMDPTSAANPSAEFCVAHGNTYETREDAEGNAYGVCILSGGGEEDAWEYFRVNAT